jgi:hypothetical protein
MKDFTVKEDAGFRLRVKSWKCVRPVDLNCVEFIQECKNKDGDVESTSTYQFFMSDEEIKFLAKNLLTMVSEEDTINV